MPDFTNPAFSIVTHLISATLGAAIGYWARKINERIYERFWPRNASRTRFAIPISAKYDDLRGLADFSYNLVRYGTDEHLTRPDLSDAEREEGRLQTTFHPVKLKPGAKLDGRDTTLLTFTMPVHTSLGTQFKLFAVPKRTYDSVTLCDVLKTQCKDEITITAPSPEVWFLLNDKKFKDFPIVSTSSGGYQNNYYRIPFRASRS